MSRTAFEIRLERTMAANAAAAAIADQSRVDQQVLADAAARSLIGHVPDEGVGIKIAADRNRTDAKRGGKAAVTVGLNIVSQGTGVHIA